MNAKIQTQSADVIDATAASVDKRLKEVEDYASQIDEALGSAIERIEALEKGAKAAPTSSKSMGGVEKRLAALEARGDKVQQLVHPSADNPPQGEDSMGLPKVV